MHSKTKSSDLLLPAMDDKKCVQFEETGSDQVTRDTEVALKYFPFACIAQLIEQWFCTP